MNIDSLVQELLDQIPEEKFKSTDEIFCDPAFAGGQFLYGVADRLMRYGHSVENICGRLYGFESKPVYMNTVEIQGLKEANLEMISMADKQSLEKHLPKLKGCTVLMNAPYLKGFWKDVVNNCFEVLEPSVLVTVNPDPTEKPSKAGDQWKDLAREKGLQYRTDATSHFNVESGKIGAFVFVTDKPFVPETISRDNPAEDSLLEKLMAKGGTAFCRRGDGVVNGRDKKKPELHHDLVDKPDKQHPYKTVTSASKDGMKVEYSDKKHVAKKFVDELSGHFVIMNRYLGKNNPDPLYEVKDMENYNTSDNILSFKLLPGETLDNFRSVYCSKAYRKALELQRNGGFDTQSADIIRLERLDMTKTWTDQDIYKYFKFTKAEIDAIESGN